MRISDWSSDVCSSDLPIEDLAGQAEQHVERSRRARVEIIEADEAVQAVAFVEELEFMAERLVAIDCGDVDVDRRQRVEVNRDEAGVLAARAEPQEPTIVGKPGRHVHREALRLQILLRSLAAGEADGSEEGRESG